MLQTHTLVLLSERGEAFQNFYNLFTTDNSSPPVRTLKPSKMTTHHIHTAGTFFPSSMKKIAASGT